MGRRNAKGQEVFTHKAYTSGRAWHTLQGTKETLDHPISGLIPEGVGPPAENLAS